MNDFFERFERLLRKWQEEISLLISFMTSYQNYAKMFFHFSVNHHKWRAKNHNFTMINNRVLSNEIYFSSAACASTSL